MQLLEVRVLESLSHSDSLLWVETHHLLEQVNGLWVCTPEVLAEVFALLLRKIFNELFVLFNGNLVNKILVRTSDKINNFLNLIFFIVCWQKRFSGD